LRIMNRRASEIGATISVCRADENGGTVVTCTLPHDSKRLRQGGSQNSSAQG